MNSASPPDPTFTMSRTVLRLPSSRLNPAENGGVFLRVRAGVLRRQGARDCKAICPSVRALIRLAGNSARRRSAAMAEQCFSAPPKRPPSTPGD
jgi:hypothetical protein